MKRADEELPTREGYDRWAKTYDGYDNPLVLLEEPIVRGRIGDPTGLTVADVGCGTGRHTLWLAQRGATVTGVDFSRGMLDVLRDKLGDHHVTLLEHDLSQGVPLPDASQNLAISCLVLEHVAELKGALAELARIVKPGGRVIVSDFHPEMLRRGFHARFREAPEGPKIQICGATHSISDYVMAATRAGLDIHHMSEHLVPESLTANSESARKWVGEPMLLVFELHRPKHRGSAA